MLARIRFSVKLVALVHIDVAVGANVSFSTSASVSIGSVRQGGAVGSVSARVGRTVVRLSAVSPLPSPRAGARVAAQGGQVTGATVLAGRAVAHVRHRSLAQRILVSNGAGALEAGSLAGKLDDSAGPAVLALLVARAARVQVLAVLSDKSRRAPENIEMFLFYFPILCYIF